MVSFPSTPHNLPPTASPFRREDTVFSELWIVGREELLPDDKAQGGEWVGGGVVVEERALSGV